MAARLTMERRRWVRVVESVPFMLDGGRYEIVSETVNLSEHGAMCQINRDIPLMTKLDIALEIPAFGRRRYAKQVTAKGVVVRKDRLPRSTRYEIAVYFSHISPPAAALLHKFIESRLK